MLGPIQLSLLVLLKYIFVMLNFTNDPVQNQCSVRQTVQIIDLVTRNYKLDVSLNRALVGSGRFPTLIRGRGPSCDAADKHLD